MGEATPVVLALRYGRGTYPLSALLAGAAATERVALAWMFWAVLPAGENRVILVDGGVGDPELARRRGVEGHLDPVKLLTGAGLAPSRVSDVVLSHLHWDHSDGLAAFPDARVWVRAAEVEWARTLLVAGRGEAFGVRRRDLEGLEKRTGRGNLMLLGSGDRPEVSPGVRLLPGGGHTPGIQWVEVEGAAGRRVVLASDSAYLYANLDRSLPSGTAADPEADRRSLGTLVAIRREGAEVVPGHDPEVFARFPGVAPDVVRVA